MRRLHRTEIRQALEFSGASCESQNDILAIVDDLLYKNENLGSMLSALRAKVASYKKTGTTNDARSVKSYVTHRLCRLEEEAHIYYDPQTMRFSVLGKAKTKTSLEHLGSYSAPFDRAAIREDVDFVFADKR